MKTTKWTPERDQLLRTLRAMDISCQEMLARINDGFEPKMDARQMQKRAEAIKAPRSYRQAAHYRTGPREDGVKELQAMSDSFARAGRDAGLRLQVVKLAIPPRQGIMTGKPPNHADLIAARVAMAARSRLAVADVGVRGLV